MSPTLDIALHCPHIAYSMPTQSDGKTRKGSFLPKEAQRLSRDNLHFGSRIEEDAEEPKAENLTIDNGLIVGRLVPAGTGQYLQGIESIGRWRAGDDGYFELSGTSVPQGERGIGKRPLQLFYDSVLRALFDDGDEGQVSYDVDAPNRRPTPLGGAHDFFRSGETDDSEDAGSGITRDIGPNPRSTD